MDLESFGKKKKKKKKIHEADLEGDDVNDGENKENGKCKQIIRRYQIFIQITRITLR